MPRRAARWLRSWRVCLRLARRDAWRDRWRSALVVVLLYHTNGAAEVPPGSSIPLSGAPPESNAVREFSMYHDGTANPSATAPGLPSLVIL